MGALSITDVADRRGRRISRNDALAVPLLHAQLSARSLVTLSRSGV
jgi:hypothetical protein